MFFVLLLAALAAGSGAPHRRPSFTDRSRVRVEVPFRPEVPYDGTPSGAVLTATPGTITSGGAVTLKWSGVTHADSADWVSVYCGDECGVSPTNVLDWHRVTTGKDGTGTTTFPNLLNMRCHYMFRYYQDVSGGYKLVAQSNNVTVKGGSTAPEYVRLSVTNSPDEMQVTWTSGSQDHPGVVQYGTTVGSYPNSAKATQAAVTYRNTDMCNQPATLVTQQHWRDPGYTHTVILTKLSPNTKYYYRYGNPTEGWNQEDPSTRYFVTAPPTGPNAEASFLAYGDMGTYAAPRSVETAHRCEAEVATGKYQLVLHFGDISYAWGYGYIWEQFHALIEPYSSKVPYMVSIGNHEYCYTSGGQHDPSGAGSVSQPGFKPSWGNYGDDSEGECSVPMYYRFRTPTNGHGLYWYSFDYANVHVIQFSSEHNFTKGAPQYEWIVDDLTHVDRTKTPWVVITAHRPMYNSENYASDYRVGTNMRAALDDVLHDHKVDLFLAGHYHSWERTCPVYKEVCTPGATTHITVGSAGQSLDSVAWMGKKWHAYGEFDYGYMRLFTNRTTLRGEYVRNTDGTVRDHFTLKVQF